ncbi:MAG: hypothetical protein RL748_3161 [Pseudomonadota bacterium]
MKTLNEIQTSVATLAKRIKAHELPAFGSSIDDGSPFVEVADGQYHYVVEERGQEISRQSSSALADLLYWIFADITHSMAFRYELAHRIAGQDSRRLGFAQQLALLEQLDPAMAARREQEIAAILQAAPYVDG